MKLAVSNISLPAYQHSEYFKRLKETGFDAIEVAPSRIWRDTWHNLTATQVREYRKTITAAGLDVCGLHSLFFDQPDLSLFGDRACRNKLVEFLVHLSSVCRDLGGKTLVYGSPNARRKGSLSVEEANEMASDVFEQVCARTDDHGTVFCMETLSHAETDFCNKLEDVLDLYAVINQPQMGVHIDMRAFQACDDVKSDVFQKVKGKIAHVHINASDLGILKETDTIYYSRFAQLFTEIGYDGVLSLEQRSVNSDDHWGPIQESLIMIRKYFQ